MSSDDSIRRHWERESKEQVRRRQASAKKEKVWTYDDTTNAVNRDQYVAAHLEGMAHKERRNSDANYGGVGIADERPMRTSLSGAPVVDRHRERISRKGTDDRRWSNWRSWDIAANAELAQATLTATQTLSGATKATFSSDEASSSPGPQVSPVVSGRGLLPPHLHRSTLKMQLPLQHRLVSEFHDKVRDGEFNAMVADGRKLPLRLINGYVRPVCASEEQQAKLLAYYLYDIREMMSVAQRTVFYQQLTEVFEASSPDHLAILMSNVQAIGKSDRGRMMAVMRDEIVFAKFVPYSLGGVLVMATPNNVSLLNDTLKLLQQAPDPRLYPDGVWALLARRMGSRSLEEAQKVVDAATRADSRHFRNTELWNAYISAAPLEHATEMLMVNMPRYSAQPDMFTFDEISKKCAEDGNWEVALEVAKSAARAAPLEEEAQRFHDAYKRTIDSAIGVLKAKGKTDELTQLKRLIPLARNALRK